MAMVRVRDTAPELALRRELHRRGLRYRVDAAIPGLPRRRVDILFTKQRIVVFIDGCFWHGCSRHRSIPENNREWWAEKIAATRTRDHTTDHTLKEMGYQTLRFWEHEDVNTAADIVEATIRRALD
jgi:DNA mismatch endonuclease, patch repair protein